MYLCLDLGNSHLCGGVFDENNLLLQFRYDTRNIGTSDELGVFFRSVLHENKIDYTKLRHIGIASVVPTADYTVRSACIKYLHFEPIFLTPGVKTGISVKTHNASEVGPDLIAGAIAAKKIYPNEDVLIFDLGTATTCCYINKNAELVGVSIAPGIRLMMESLQKNTARLFGVDIIKPEYALGKNTKMAIQSGIYYAQIGLVTQLIESAILENNLPKKPFVIGTGGFSQIFTQQKFFDKLVPELVLEGIKMMLDLNLNVSRKLQ